MLKRVDCLLKTVGLYATIGVSHGGTHSHPSDHLFLRHRRVLSHHRDCDALHVVLCLDVLRIPIEMSSFSFGTFEIWTEFVLHPPLRDMIFY